MPQTNSASGPTLIERKARPLLVDALSYSRVVFVQGARQVGKSTLARQVVESDHPAVAVTLDDQVSRDAAAADPHGFAGDPPDVAGAPVGRGAFTELVARGGYPAVHRLPERQRRDWYRDYAQSIVEMPRLLRLLASHSAKILDFRKVAGDLQISDKTVKARASLRERDWRVIAAMRDKYGDRFKAGVVLYTGRQTIPLGNRIWAVPVSGLWA